MAISAAQVKALREKTGLPMMDCKKALTEANGDEDQAIEILKKAGLGKVEKMASREAAEGRIACFVDAEKQRAGIVELRCETAPVANTDDFANLAKSVARHVTAMETPDAQKVRAMAHLDDSSKTVDDEINDVFNRIRENMQVHRVDIASGHVGYYVHHNAQIGVLIEMSGECPDELKADVCMHIAAMNPPCLKREDAPAAEVEEQKAAFLEEAKGKPPQIAEKIVDGKLNRWYSEFVLLEQPFAKDDKKSVTEVLKEVAPDLTVTRFIRYQVGQK